MFFLRDLLVMRERRHIPDAKYIMREIFSIYLNFEFWILVKMHLHNLGFLHIYKLTFLDVDVMSNQIIIQ